MAIDFLNPNDRKKVIDNIKSEENKQRKAASLKQFEIFQDRQHQYVIEYLRQQFSQSTVKEMPVISSVNLAKKIVGQEASLYKSKPTREVMGSEQDQLNAQMAYEQLNFDAKMLKANQVYKLQNQACVMIIPKGGKLIARVLYAHHYDVVPSDIDPEVAEAVIISTFDKQAYMTAYSDSATSNPSGYSPQSGKPFRDNLNQPIGDPDDYKANLERYVVWTKDYNFIMDGKGNIITPAEDIISPLAEFQMMPFIDIASDKDFEYFVRQGQSLTDFSVQYCGALSDLGNVVKLQSYSQAYLSGPKELLPESIQIGPNFILKLPIDPNDKVETKFGFASPNSDIAGSIKYIETLLANFLTARGVDPKSISGSAEATNFSSGVERLLYEISKFEASKTDMEVFRYAEAQAFEIIKAWTNVLSGSDMIDIPAISQEAKMHIKFSEPQMVQSKDEKLKAMQLEIELGVSSRVKAIEDLYGVSEDKALEMAKKFDEQQALLVKEPQVVQLQEQINGEDTRISP